MTQFAPVVRRWQVPPRSAASIRGRSASKATRGYDVEKPDPVFGLLNRIGVGLVELPSGQ